MPDFQYGQTVWYLRPGMAVPLEMEYLGIIFELQGLHAVLTKQHVVLETPLRCIYRTPEEAGSIARLWVKDRLQKITVEIRGLIEEQEKLKKEVSNDT